MNNSNNHLSSFRQVFHYKILSNTFWSGAGQYASQAIGLLNMMIMARLLGASDFGIIVMVQTVNGFLLLFTALGMTQIVVQNRELNHTDLNKLSGLSFYAGCVAAAVCVLAAAPISRFFSSNELKQIFYVLSAALIFTSLCQVPTGYLQRTNHFKKLCLITITSSMATFSFGVFLAFRGWGYWALVVQALLRPVFLYFMLLVSTRIAPALKWDSLLFQKVWKNIGHLSGFSFVNYFHRHIDDILIGRKLGMASLGFYTRSYGLQRMLLNSITGFTGPVLHASLSNEQNNIDSMREIFLGYSTKVFYFSCVLMAVCAFFSKELIFILWGAGWSDSVWPFFWLALSGMHQGLYGLLGVVFISRGKYKELLLSSLINTALFVVAVVLGLGSGIDGVARNYSVMSHLILFPLLFYVWSVLLSGNYFDYLKKIMPFYVLALILPMLRVYLESFVSSDQLSVFSIFLSFMAGLLPLAAFSVFILVKQLGAGFHFFLSKKRFARLFLFRR